LLDLVSGTTIKQGQKRYDPERDADGITSPAIEPTRKSMITGVLGAPLPRLSTRRLPGDVAKGLWKAAQQLAGLRVYLLG
jgi:hypothetical protein